MMAVQQALIPKHCHIKLNNALATMQRPTHCPFPCPFSRIHWDPVRVSIDLQFQPHSVSARISVKRTHSEHLEACLLLELFDFHRWLSSVPPRVFLCNYGSLFVQHLLSGAFMRLNDPALRSDTGFEKNKRCCVCERDVERHFVCETSDFSFPAAVCPPPLIFKQSPRVIKLNGRKWMTDMEILDV